VECSTTCHRCRALSGPRLCRAPVLSPRSVQLAAAGELDGAPGIRLAAVVRRAMVSRGYTSGHLVRSPFSACRGHSGDRSGGPFTPAAGLELADGWAALFHLHANAAVPPLTHRSITSSRGLRPVESNDVWGFHIGR
jgi:hypothetical protein